MIFHILTLFDLLTPLLKLSIYFKFIILRYYYGIFLALSTSDLSLLVPATYMGFAGLSTSSEHGKVFSMSLGPSFCFFISMRTVLIAFSFMGLLYWLEKGSSFDEEALLASDASPITDS